MKKWDHCFSFLRQQLVSAFFKPSVSAEPRDLQGTVIFLHREPFSTCLQAMLDVEAQN